MITQVECGLCHAVALVADDDRRAFGQSFGRQRDAVGLERCGIDRDAMLLQSINGLGKRHLTDRLPESSAHGRTDDLGCSRVGAALAQDDQIERECVGGAQDGAQIARVLQTVEQDSAAHRREIDRLTHRSLAREQHALRGLDIGRQVKQRFLCRQERRALRRCTRQQCIIARGACTHEHRTHPDVRVQRFTQHFFALADHLTGLQAIFLFSRQPCEVFERRILAACDRSKLHVTS